MEDIIKSKTLFSCQDSDPDTLDQWCMCLGDGHGDCENKGLVPSVKPRKELNVWERYTKEVWMLKPGAWIDLVSRKMASLLLHAFNF